MDGHASRERVTIRVSEQGLEIRRREGGEVLLSASEALMLLDILRQEEPELARFAEEASPWPMRVRIRPE